MSSVKRFTWVVENFKISCILLYWSRTLVDKNFTNMIAVSKPETKTPSTEPNFIKTSKLKPVQLVWANLISCLHPATNMDLCTGALKNLFDYVCRLFTSAGIPRTPACLGTTTWQWTASMVTSRTSPNCSRRTRLCTIRSFHTSLRVSDTLLLT